MSASETRWLEHSALHRRDREEAIEVLAAGGFEAVGALVEVPPGFVTEFGVDFPHGAWECLVRPVGADGNYEFSEEPDWRSE